MTQVLVLDSVTKLPGNAGHAVAYCASHGGRFSGMCALHAGVRAVIFCDAGVGLHQAGIAALEILASYGVPAATVGHNTARIGNGQDGYARGRISHTNAVAEALGVRPGDPCSSTLERFARQAPEVMLRATELPTLLEQRSIIELPGAGQVVLTDSNSLISQEDAGEIVVCGSHGGVLGDDPLTAVRFDVKAIIFNDADRGIDNAGLSRLPALDQRAIPAACVSAWTARIGDGLSGYQTGIISALNDTALAYGGALGMDTQEFVRQMSVLDA